MRTYLLTVLQGPDIGRSLELQVGKTLIGRQPTDGTEPEGVVRWTLMDKTVSRTHVEVELADPGVPILRHLSATNDTYVDRRKISQENLQEGQVFQMGQTAVVMEVIRKVVKLRP